MNPSSLWRPLRVLIFRNLLTADVISNKTLTLSGNIIGRIAYSNQSGSDPVSATKATDKLVQADISFNF
jgi:hypothetical protein